MHCDLFSMPVFWFVVQFCFVFFSFQFSVTFWRGKEGLGEGTGAHSLPVICIQRKGRHCLPESAVCCLLSLVRTHVSVQAQAPERGAGRAAAPPSSLWQQTCAFVPPLFDHVTTVLFSNIWVSRGCFIWIITFPVLSVLRPESHDVRLTYNVAALLNICAVGFQSLCCTD